MTLDGFVMLKGVEVGVESGSGKAVCVKVNGEWKWIPLSLVRSIHRNPKIHDDDAIEIASWFADKEGLE